MSAQDKLNWLRDHMMVFDESEADSYENIMESVISVLDTAWAEVDRAEGTDEMRRAIATLSDAINQRSGTGSALRR